MHNLAFSSAIEFGDVSRKTTAAEEYSELAA